MQISAIVGGIAFLGFLGFLGGVALVVINASQGRPVRGGVLLAVIGIVVGVIFSVVSSGIVIVEPQQRAVVFNVLNGELREPPLGPGTHVVVPIVNEYTVYDVFERQFTMSGESRGGDDEGAAVDARTSDGQEVSLDITVQYAIDPAQVNLVHVRWQNRFEEGFVRPAIRSILRNEVSLYTAAALYGVVEVVEGEEDVQQVGGRAELENNTEARMRAAFEEEGLVLTALRIRGINFSADFVASIERRVVADQDRQRAQTEAETRRIEAEGRASAEIAQADGERQAAILRAQGEAEALRLVSEQIAANPNLIPYLYVTNLSDNVSIAIVPSNTPFLFDLNSFTANEDFTPPPVSTPEGGN